MANSADPDQLASSALFEKLLWSGLGEKIQLNLSDLNDTDGLLILNLYHSFSIQLNTQ